LIIYICLYLEATKLPHDEAGSWTEEIHGPLPTWTHSFIISHLCTDFIFMLKISIEYAPLVEGCEPHRLMSILSPLFGFERYLYYLLQLTW